MPLMSFKALTWGTIAAAAGSACLLVVVSGDLPDLAAAGFDALSNLSRPAAAAAETHCGPPRSPDGSATRAAAPTPADTPAPH